MMNLHTTRSDSESSTAVLDAPQECRLSAGVAIRLICAALVLALWTPVARAAQDDPVPPAPIPLISEAPADAWLVAFVDGAARDEWGSVWNAAVGRTGDQGDALREAVAEIAPGSITLALTGLPAVPFSIGITLAFETPLDGDALPSALRDRLMPAWNGSPLGRGIGEMSIDERTATIHLKLMGQMPVVLSFVAKGGIAYISSTPGAADAWRAGSSQGGSFLDSDDYARATAALDAPPTFMVHANLRTLVPLAESALNGLLEGLGDGVQVGDIETLTLLEAPVVMRENPDDVGDDPDRARRSASHRPVNLSRLRLAVGVKEITPGPLRLLAPAPGESTLQRFHPRGTDLFIRGAMDRATDLVEDVAEIAGAIDPAIVEEYEDEREDFRRETGVEPQTEFLADFAGEWSFGGLLREGGVRHPLIAVGLRDGDRLSAHIRTLQIAYQLEMTSNPYRNQVIHHALRKAGPFSYAIVDNVLLLSPEPQTVAAAIDAALDGKSLANDRRFDELHRSLGGPTSTSLFVDAAGVAGRFLPNSRDGEPVDPMLAALARSGGGAMLTTRAMDRMIAIELLGSAKTVRAGMNWLASFVRRELLAQRRFALRQVSMSRIQQLTTACLMFADAHERQWPRRLDDLLAAGLLGEPPAARELLELPYPVEGGPQPRYLYRSPAQSNDAAQPMIGEPRVHDGGACFGFADGHAEWIESPRAELLIAALRRANQ